MTGSGTDKKDVTDLARFYRKPSMTASLVHDATEGPPGEAGDLNLPHVDPDIASEAPGERPLAHAAHAAPTELAPRLVLAATFTIEPLLRGIRFWLDKLGLQSEVDVAPLRAAGARAFGPNERPVVQRARDERGDAPRPTGFGSYLPEHQAASADFLRPYIQGTARELERAMRTHRQRGGARTLLLLCPSHAASPSEVDALLAEAERGSWRRWASALV